MSSTWPIRDDRAAGSMKLKEEGGCWGGGNRRYGGERGWGEKPDQKVIIKIDWRERKDMRNFSTHSQPRKRN